MSFKYKSGSLTVFLEILVLLKMRTLVDEALTSIALNNM